MTLTLDYDIPPAPVRETRNANPISANQDELTAILEANRDTQFYVEVPPLALWMFDTKEAHGLVKTLNGNPALVVTRQSNLHWSAFIAPAWFGVDEVEPTGITVSYEIAQRLFPFFDWKWTYTRELV